MTTKIVTEYVKLHNEKRELEARLSQVKKDIELREPMVEEHFAEESFESVRTESGTAYLHREILVSLRAEESGTHGDAHTAMRKHGLDWMIKETINPSTLRAHFADAVKSGEPIPEDIAAYLNIIDRHRVRVRNLS